MPGQEATLDDLQTCEGRVGRRATFFLAVASLIKGDLVRARSLMPILLDFATPTANLEDEKSQYQELDGWLRQREAEEQERRLAEEREQAQQTEADRARRQEADRARRQAQADRRARTREAPATREPGLLTVNSYPWSEVHVDGTRVGYTPLLEHSVPAGLHTIRLVFPGAGNREITEKVEIRPAKHLRIVKRLPPSERRAASDAALAERSAAEKRRLAAASKRTTSRHRRGGVGATLLALGGSVAAAGLVLNVASYNEYYQPGVSQAQYEEGRGLTATGFVVGFGGIAVVVAGVLTLANPFGLPNGLALAPGPVTTFSAQF